MIKRKFLRRLSAAFTAAVLLVSLLLPSLSANAKWGTSITDTETFEALIKQVSEEENAYIGGRLRLLIYGDDVANIYYVGHSFPSSSAYQSLTDGEAGQKISFRGAQCWAYAEYCFYKFFGTTQYVNASYVKTHTNEKLSAGNLKKVLADARCGAHLRVGNTHSVCFVCENADKTGFYYLDAIGSKYHVYLHYDTYQSFCDTYSSKTIQYLCMPKEYPVCSEEGDQLTVTDVSVPVTVKKGTSPDLTGMMFVSNAALTKLTFAVKTETGDTRFEAEITPNCPAYRLNKIAADKYFLFSSLENGNYVFAFSATDESGQQITAEEPFAVSDEETVCVKKSYYTYKVERLSVPVYYEVTEDTVSYSSPAIPSAPLPLSAGAVIAADATHTDTNGEVWLRANGRWINGAFLAPHTHILSETGLCACGYDDTPAATAESGFAFAVSSCDGYDRPYESESNKVFSLAPFDSVSVTGKTENLLGEAWLKTADGYVRAENLHQAASLAVINLPSLTEYRVGDTLLPDGIRITADGTYEIPPERLAYSYSFAKAGTAKVTVSFAGASTSFTVNVLPDSGTEVWLATTNMRVRSGVGTDYEQVARLTEGTEFTVTELVQDDTYLWGKTDSGWVALQVLETKKYYCTYQSGYLYEITYDTAGGTSLPSTPKASVLSAKVTESAPQKDGFVFLGFALESETPSYFGGEAYDGLSSLTLTAVWRPSAYPAEEHLIRLTSPLTAEAFAAEWNGTLTDSYGDTVTGDTPLATGMKLYAADTYTILLMGDADGDGRIGSDDVTLLARHIGAVEQIEDSFALLSCDLDRNGSTDAEDLVALARAVAGI